jgi:MFS family permease
LRPLFRPDTVLALTADAAKPIPEPSSGGEDAPGAVPVDDFRRRRGMMFIGLAVGGVGLAMSLQMGLNANFLAEDIGVSGFQLGLLEAARESCGIVAFGVLALLAGLPEPLVGAGVLVVFALGLGGYAFVPNYAAVVGMSLLWSQGLHVWMPLPNSLTMALAEPDRTGHRLGQIQAAGAVGSGVGLAGALVLTTLRVPMRPLYLLAGAAALVAAAACLAVPRDIKTPGPRLVFRRRYGLYYLLCFLDGWRKQIFMCFAGFLLVRVHGTDLRTMLVLWCTVQAIGYFAAPRVGRLIDRVGERRILTIYFCGLIPVFLGYAFIPSRLVLYVLFVADSALFVFNTALTTYVRRLAPLSEHTPTLSVGVASNHVAAVAMPFLGAFLWRYLGPQWPFLIGALAAALSILPARFVPPRACRTTSETSFPQSGFVLRKNRAHTD